MPRGIELDSVLPELLGAIGIGDGWAIQAVAEAVEVPVLGSIGMGDDLDEQDP